MAGRVQKLFRCSKSIHIFVFRNLQLKKKQRQEIMQDMLIDIKENSFNEDPANIQQVTVLSHL